MTKRFFVVALIAGVLAACGKASDKVAEKVAEKAIESGISKDGGKAKVDLSSGAMKVTTTDAAGKTSQLELGSAKVSESELGIAFYPGTQPREGGANKVSTPDGTTYTVMLHSDDAPDKVAGFYRDKLKAQAEGRQYNESSSDGSHLFMLADDKARQVTQVVIGKGDPKGSDIQIVANRGTAK